MSTRQKGHHWEQVAESFLQQRGLTPLERNFHSRFGEIDLIMSEQSFLVFVEVKFRERAQHCSGVESIHVRKRQRIESTAAFYLARYPRLAHRPCRFDVISISGKEGDVIEWIKDAFQATRG